MPSRHPVALLASVAVLGLGATACEKQNPIVTVTAGGVVVKARAVEYCRPGESECRKTGDEPTLTLKPGDTLGIDVPRSLAEQGWTLGPQGPQTEVWHDHYRALTIDADENAQILEIHRDTKHGRGVWRFKLRYER